MSCKGIAGWSGKGPSEEVPWAGFLVRNGVSGSGPAGGGLISPQGLGGLGPSEYNRCWALRPPEPLLTPRTAPGASCRGRCGGEEERKGIPGALRFLDLEGRAQEGPPHGQSSHQHPSQRATEGPKEGSGPGEPTWTKPACLHGGKPFLGAGGRDSRLDPRESCQTAAVMLWEGSQHVSEL